ncbi:unnamed protein product [Cylindrotheca closterium]|uniref:Uncharacterized protein n=1 Tax=Cylindrotheca closterium TaxID=2856 RepID=A0AAD2FZ40_9STRA|nr:unnamed protein product [Cylindrotheca closterium]
MRFESFGTVDSLEPINETSTMAESNAWKEGLSMTAGLAARNQINPSGLSNSQLSQHTQSSSIQKPNNLQVNIIINNRTNSNGACYNPNNLGVDADNNIAVSQSSNRLSSPFDLSFDDPLGGFPNKTSHDLQNQQSDQVPSQPQHVSSLSNMLTSWQAADQYPSFGGGSDSSTLLTMGNNKESTSNTSQGRANKIISNRFLLGCKVQPFTRNDDEIEDDDLFKVFDDDLGSHTTKKLQMPKTQPIRERVLVPDYPAVSSVSDIHQQAGALQRQNETIQNIMISNMEQGGSDPSVRDFATLRQQEHQEEARMQKLCRVDKPSDESSRLVSQNDETEDSFDTQFYVPSTMMPPTVLASTLPSSFNKRKSGNESSERKRPRVCSNGASPQQKLEELLQKAGIVGFRRVKADEAEYEVVPSALQLASFGTRVVKAVHTSDEKALSELMKCGLSPNPCNQFRDSILDLVCKRGNFVIFDCLIQHGTDLQTMDGFGRTPLHHCCWASSFCRPIVDAILERDPMQLMIEDKRGQTPLEYVRADLASDWIHYLESSLHKYWGNTIPTLSSPKAKRPSGTLPDPPNAMPVNLAAMVSSGKLLPAQVIPMIKSRKLKSH